LKQTSGVNFIITDSNTPLFPSMC